MNLFHETENKYYELLSYLLNGKAEYTKEEIRSLSAQILTGEPDFEVMEALFPETEEEQAVYRRQDGVYAPALPLPFPVRCNAIERQAAKQLCGSGYQLHFLKEETRERLRAVTAELDDEWDQEAVCIKNQYADGVSSTPQEYEGGLRLIARAIEAEQAILCDNVREGRFAYRDDLIFPVKIEYSFVGDRYWICAYDPKQRRYLKMRLDTMSRIRPTRRQKAGLRDGYARYVKEHTRTAVLEVDPIRHVIERCFRIFSYYDRRAVYQREERRYRLEIRYFVPDEKELIRDILSLGSSVLVLEPSGLRETVRRRIALAAARYQEDG